MASEGFGRALSGAVWLTAYSLLNAAGGRWAPLLVPFSLSSGPVLGALVAVGSYRSAFAFQALGSLAKLLLALAGFPPLPAVFLSSLASLAFGLALAALRLGFARPRGWRSVFVVAAGNYLLNFSAGFAASLGVVLVERVAGSSEAGLLYLVAMAVLVLSSFSSSLTSSSIPPYGFGRVVSTLPLKEVPRIFGLPEEAFKAAGRLDYNSVVARALFSARKLRFPRTCMVVRGRGTACTSCYPLSRFRAL